MEHSRPLTNRNSFFKSIFYLLLIISIVLFTICIVLCVISLNKLLVLTRPGQLTDMERFFLFSEVMYGSLWGIACMITGSILLIGSLKMLKGSH